MGSAKTLENYLKLLNSNAIKTILENNENPELLKPGLNDARKVREGNDVKAKGEQSCPESN
jgi:hypothetical protein